MKKILFTIFAFLCAGVVAHADTITLNWVVNDTTTNTNTCEIGGNIVPPVSTPTKTGYTFVGWRSLPYTPLEYISSTGGQILDSGIAVSSNLKIEIVFANNGLLHIGYTGLNGSRYAIISEGSTLYTNFGGYASYRISMTDADVLNKKHFLYIDKYNNRAVFDGEEKVLIYDVSRSVSFPIFNSDSIQTIYYLKMWIGNNLVRDFIPVKDTNGVVCMYDKVSESFFYNSGTGDFVAGPIIDSIIEE